MSERIAGSIKKYNSTIEELFHERILTQIPLTELALYLYMNDNFNTKFTTIGIPLLIEIAQYIDLNTSVSLDEIMNNTNFSRKWQRNFVENVLEELISFNILKKENNKYKNKNPKRKVEERINSAQFSKSFKSNIIINSIERIVLLPNNNFILQSNDNEETTTEIEINDIENIKVEILLTIIKEIIYLSASEITKIKIIENQTINNKLCLINGIIIPSSIFSKVHNLIPSIIEQAFSNYYTYLSCNDAIFYDDKNRQYTFPIDSIHILGLDEKIFKNNDAYNADYISHLLNVNIPRANFPTTKPRYLSRIKVKKLRKLVKSLDKIEEYHRKKDLSKEIEYLKIAQESVSDIVTNKKVGTQIELLCWLYSKKLREKNNNQPVNHIHSVDNDMIVSILEDNSYRFSKEFKDLMCLFNDNLEEMEQREQYISILIGKYNDSIKDITEKYEYIEETQSYLTYLIQNITQRIIGLPSSEWKEYFEDKGLGYFGLAHLAINNAVFEYNSDNISSNINLFKVLDKLNYLSRFNYLLDLKNIYITDLQNPTYLLDRDKNNILDLYSCPVIEENNVDIICEMEALSELLLAYFQKITSNGVAKFYSIQNSEDKYTISSPNNNEIIIGFCSSSQTKRFKNKMSNAITQTHSDTKIAHKDVNDLIISLKRGETMLRYATSFSVVGDFLQDKTLSQRVNDLFKSENKILTEYEKIIINYNSAILVKDWCENLTIEQFAQFYDISPDEITEEQLNQIKILLYKQMSQFFISREFIEKIKKELEELNDMYEFRTGAGNEAAQYYDNSYTNYSVPELVRMSQNLYNLYVEIAESYDLERNLENNNIRRDRSGNYLRKNTYNQIDLLSIITSIDNENELVNYFINNIPLEIFENELNKLPTFVSATLEKRLNLVDLSQVNNEKYSKIKSITIFSRKRNEIQKYKNDFSKKITSLMANTEKDYYRIKETTGSKHDLASSVMPFIEKYQSIEENYIREYFSKIDSLVSDINDEETKKTIIKEIKDNIYSLYESILLSKKNHVPGFVENLISRNDAPFYGDKILIVRNQDILNNEVRLGIAHNRFMSEQTQENSDKEISLIKEILSLLVEQTSRYKRNLLETNVYYKNLTGFVETNSLQEELSLKKKNLQITINELEYKKENYMNLLLLIQFIKSKDLSYLVDENGEITIEHLDKIFKNIPSHLFEIIYSQINQVTGTNINLLKEYIKRKKCNFIKNKYDEILKEILAKPYIEKNVNYQLGYPYIWSNISDWVGDSNDYRFYHQMIKEKIYNDYFIPFYKEICAVYSDNPIVFKQILSEIKATMISQIENTDLAILLDSITESISETNLSETIQKK